VVTILALQYGDVWKNSTAKHYLPDIAFAGTVVGQLAFGYLYVKISVSNKDHEREALTLLDQIRQMVENQLSHSLNCYFDCLHCSHGRLILPWRHYWHVQHPDSLAFLREFFLFWRYA
jgi:hypothetical protein